MRRSAFIVAGVIYLFLGIISATRGELLPIPDKLVVLTFDDGCKSDVEYVAPLLKRYGFGATFFITEAWKGQNYLTWEDARKIHDAGFEIGNHTRTHPNVARLSKDKICAEIEYIEQRCKEYGIAVPKTFCYPGFHYGRDAVVVLRAKGYLFARRGVAPEFPDNREGARGPVYDPGLDHPLMLPCTGFSGPDWDFEDFVWAVEQARDGKVAILTFHGVPDVDHPWVHTDPKVFTTHMDYLRDNAYTVIAMRDLVKYVDPTRRLEGNPFEPIQQRLKKRQLKVTELRCEYAKNPLGVDTRSPRFSWILESNQRGQMQSAYRIHVASSEQKLKLGTADKWDSGKVASVNSVNIPYQGKALSSGEKCFWKVRVWDSKGRPSSWSEPAIFEMGLLQKSDWQGKWIGADKDISAPLLRKEFKVDKKIKRAVAYMSGLGYYEMFINGEKVGDHVLDPGTTYYNNDRPIELGSRVLYVTYDVTNHLKAGRNAVGIMLGNGWYSAEDDIPLSPSHREPYGDRPILLLQLNIELTDGKIVNIVSDESWKTSAGPITYNDYSNGETYDARLEKTGWSAPSYNDSSWTKAQKATAPSGKLVAQTMPPVKVVKTINPVRILNPKEGVYVYDFGQNFSGWTRLKVNGPKGTKVTIKHGMRVYEDGSLDNRSNWYIHYCTHIARQTDSYILKGKGTEVWEPRFTLHGFRYAEVTGFPGDPTLDNLQGRHVRSSVETVGRFACSNDLINRIHRAACWTFMSSMQSFPQDAADRSERVGWLGDPIPEDFMLNYDTAAYWTKWAEDLSDAQKTNGDLPVVCPLHWRRTWNGYLPWPVWKSTYPIVVWSIHQHYGDRRILREHYDGMKRLVDFLGDMADEHIINSGLGDHMEPQPDGTVASSPKHTIETRLLSQFNLIFNPLFIIAR